MSEEINEILNNLIEKTDKDEITWQEVKLGRSDLYYTPVYKIRNFMLYAGTETLFFKNDFLCHGGQIKNAIERQMKSNNDKKQKSLIEKVKRYLKINEE